MVEFFLESSELCSSVMEMDSCHYTEKNKKQSGVV